MQALLLEQQDGKTLASVQTLDESRLPEGDVTVDVHWSSLNYKDALAITGKGKIIRNFPMIPGSILPELYAPAKIRVFMPVRRCYSLAGALVKTTGAGGTGASER